MSKKRSPGFEKKEKKKPGMTPSVAVTGVTHPSYATGTYSTNLQIQHFPDDSLDLTSPISSQI